MITVIENEAVVKANPYPGMTLAEACSSMELAVSEACNDFQMNILLTEHAHLYANGTEMQYVDEAGNLNEKALEIKAKAAQLVTFCAEKISEAWDKLTEWVAAAVENFKAALAKATITEKDFKAVMGASEVFAEPIELKVAYTVYGDFLNSRYYSEMMNNDANGEAMDAVELFVNNEEKVLNIKQNDFAFAYKMVFGSELLKKIRDAKKDANKVLKEKIRDAKHMRNDEFQDEIAGLKASLKANVATTKSLIKVYHMYMNQKIAILRAVMNTPAAKAVVHPVRTKAAAAAKETGKKIASSKAGQAVAHGAEKVGDGAKEVGSKIADAAHGTVEGAKGLGEKAKKYFPTHKKD